MGSPDIIVTSAGLNAIPGRRAHPWAITAARDFGISLENHHARLVNVEMVEQADAILAMDYQNLAQLASRYPTAKRKMCLLRSYAGDDSGGREIPDPYYLDIQGTRACYRLLDCCITRLMNAVFCRGAEDHPSPSPSGR